MADVTSSTPATPKLGIPVSDAALSPVPPVEPPVFGSLDTGSQSEVVHIRPDDVNGKLSAEQRNALQLPMPPTKGDLQRLYVDQKLSAAEIAKIYGKYTGNRSGSELMRYYLQKYGIKRRDRVEELAKATATAVSNWASRHPPPGKNGANQATNVHEGTSDVGGPSRTVLDEEENAVLELLKIPQLSIRHMDEVTKGRIAVAMENLHRIRGKSLNEIAGLIENRTSGDVSRWFKELDIESKAFERSRIESITKHRKYVREPFDGTEEDKAYMLGLAHGDLHASSPWSKTIGVSTSTTHPALADLFTRLFGPFGHVYRLPRYKYDTHSYEWNLAVNLHDTFRFLLLDHRIVWEWVSRKESTLLYYLAGLWDAEGSIEVCRNRGVISIRLPIHNTNTELLKFVVRGLRELGYTPRGLQLNKRSNSKSSKWAIPHRKNYWRVVLLDLDQSQSVLRRLPFKHDEKIRMKDLALSLKRGDKWKDVSPQVKALRECFKSEVRAFVQQAEEEYARRQKNKKRKADTSPSESTNSERTEGGVENTRRSTVMSDEHEARLPVVCVLEKDAERRGWRQDRVKRVKAPMLGWPCTISSPVSSRG